MSKNKELKSIEIVEIGEISVMAKRGSNIFDAAAECINLAKYLKLRVNLHFNDKVIHIYVNSTLKDILEKLNP